MCVAGGGDVDVVWETVDVVSHHSEGSGDVDMVSGSRGGDNDCGSVGALVGTDGGGGAGPGV